MKVIDGIKGIQKSQYHTVESDKTMEEIVSKFKEMEKEGKVKVKRVSSINELKNIPPHELTSTERQALTWMKTKELSDQG